MTAEKRDALNGTALQLVEKKYFVKRTGFSPYI